MYVNDVRTLKEADEVYKAFIHKTEIKLNEKSKHSFNSRWYGSQFDDVKNRLNINLRGRENLFTTAGFNLLRNLMTIIQNGSASSGGAFDMAVASSTTVTFNYSSSPIVLGSPSSSNGVFIEAGTDTSTATTSATTILHAYVASASAAVSGGSGTASFSGIFVAGTLGSASTFTNIGELGISANNFGTSQTIIDRLAVADGTFSVVNVNNDFNQTFTDAWSITF